MVGWMIKNLIIDCMLVNKIQAVKKILNALNLATSSLYAGQSIKIKKNKLYFLIKSSFFAFVFYIILKTTI